jgi:hypothetical protein
MADARARGHGCRVAVGRSEDRDDGDDARVFDVSPTAIGRLQLDRPLAVPRADGQDPSDERRVPYTHHAIGADVFFRLSTLELALILAAVVFGTTGLGFVLGRYLRGRSDHLREPLGVLQAALLGLVGLVLAFGLALAVGRYEARRAAVVDDANAIGTTYLRAQTLAEPVRTQSLQRLVRYTDTSIRLSRSVPTTTGEGQAIADGQKLQRELWGLAGQALAEAPLASAPRLYVESLNEMIDMQTVRVAALNNRVPGAVLAVEVIFAAVALGLLAFYLAILGRGVVPVLLAAALIGSLLLVTFDLDRPTRGLIRVPATPLTSLRASMNLPPAAAAPSKP